MAIEALPLLLLTLDVVRPALTAPGFENFRVLFGGWVLTQGTHAVTEALVQGGVAGRRHHERFHRFFSRGTWSPDEMGLWVCRCIVGLLAEKAELAMVVDDTLAPKKGPQVFGIGSHIDAVRSTKRRKIFCFGHCWVTLAIVLPVPFSTRTWALPILFRLYRTTKDCERKGLPHRKKTELARELLDVVAAWNLGRRIRLSMDSAYCNDTVMRKLPECFTVFGAMRPDAVLTAAPRSKKPHANGRPRVRGAVLPKPEMLARDASVPWRKTQASLYGQKQWVDYKMVDAQWYRACGPRLLRIVVVRVTDGKLALRVFFCTDLTLDARQILEGYSQRWAIEICFRDLKQHLGFADSSARKQAAVERTAPFVGLIYSLLVIWALRGAHRLPVATPPLRPWYRSKRGLAFADVLRAAQRTLSGVDLLDLPSTCENLRKLSSPERRRGAGRLKRAA
jgi:hypothetical protein